LSGELSIDLATPDSRGLLELESAAWESSRLVVHPRRERRTAAKSGPAIATSTGVARGIENAATMSPGSNECAEEARRKAFAKVGFERVSRIPASFRALPEAPSCDPPVHERSFSRGRTDGHVAR
jgi:hypothetical protein